MSPRTGMTAEDRQQVTDLVRATLDQAKRRNPGPELHVGVVQTAAPGASWTVPVALDVADNPIIFPQNITNDPLLPGQRVMVYMAPEGAFVVGSFLNQFGLLAYDTRNTTFSCGASTSWFSSGLACRVTFPNSGKVRIKFNGGIYSSAGSGGYVELRVWDQTLGALVGDVTGDAQARVHTMTTGAASTRIHYEHVVAGLTPGDTSTWDLMVRATVIPTDAGIIAGATGGVARFDVYSEPLYPNTPG